MAIRLLVLVAVAALQPAGEPPPRALAAVALEVGAPLTHVSSVRELADGRLLLSNARGPALLVLDPASGTLTPIGAAGGGPDRYARPGGLYAGPNGTTLMIDRGQTRAFTITANAALGASRSIARKGFSTSSDADVDLQRLDAAGFVYFPDRDRTRQMMAAEGRVEATIVRLEAGTQTVEEVAVIRGPVRRTVGGGDGVIFSRSIIGSPADGWDVAADGRVAVVRGDPYRVEWYGRDGKAIRGPVIDYSPVPMTDADKDHYRRTVGRGTASVGMTGGARTDSAATDMLFSSTKAPFDPDDVAVSPDGRVWVARTGPLGETTQTFDVFDQAGRRVDRIALPAGGRLVGFGSGAIYVRYPAGEGKVELRKYRVSK